MHGHQMYKIYALHFARMATQEAILFTMLTVVDRIEEVSFFIIIIYWSERLASDSYTGLSDSTRALSNTL